MACGFKELISVSSVCLICDTGATNPKRILGSCRKKSKYFFLKLDFLFFSSYYISIMNKVKIYTHGADHITCQLPRIKDGLADLGNEIET